MKETTYPVALIFFALCANQAEASPRVEGIARCALYDGARCETPADESTPCDAALAAYLETDDLTQAAVERELRTTEEPALATALVGSPTPEANLALPRILERTLFALRSAILVPLRYGCAVFGAGPEPTSPVKKKKPRMLTLF